MIAHMTSFARNEAEIAALELDAVGAGAARDREVRQKLVGRCNAMLDEWVSAMRLRGHGEAWWTLRAAEHAGDAFWDRLRQLSAAAPWGHA